MKYRYNPSCGCGRCRAHGYMGPALLIILGVLFLLDQSKSADWMAFEATWPALLIVVGLVMFLQHNASAAGHVPRTLPVPPVAGQAGMQPPTTGYPMQPQGPVVTPPPTPPGGSLKAGSTWNQPGDPEAPNG